MSRSTSAFTFCGRCLLFQLILSMPSDGHGKEQPDQLLPDHAYIWVSKGAPEAEALVQLGIRQWPDLSNTGEGVTWTGFQFENFYLELLWVSDEPQFLEKWVAWHEPHRERANWRTSGAAPFALAFRRNNYEDATTPELFQVEGWWDEQGGYVSGLDGRFPFLMLMGSRYSMPNPSWMTPELRTLAEHPLGIRKLTSWTLQTPHKLDHEAIDLLIEHGALNVKKAPEYALELTFDDGRQKLSFDARPGLPLIINY